MDDRAALRRITWVVLFLCILVDFGILNLLTFQPDVFNFNPDSQTVYPPPSPNLSEAGYVLLGGFSLLQIGLVGSILRLRKVTSQSIFG